MSKWRVILISFLSLLVFAVPTQAEEHGQYEIHEVIKGDTLWKISHYYGVPFQNVLEANTHFENPNLIYPADHVKIPFPLVEGVYKAK